MVPAALCHSGAGVGGEVVVTWIRRRQLLMCGELVATQRKVCYLCKCMQLAFLFCAVEF